METWIYLVPEANMPKDFRNYSRVNESESLSFLQDFEGPGFVVYEFGLKDRNLTAEFEACFRWSDEVESELQEIDQSIIEVTESTPQYEWYFENQFPSLDKIGEPQQPIFAIPRIHGVEALMYEGDSILTLLEYEKVIKISGDAKKEEKEFAGAELAGNYYKNKSLERVKLPEGIDFTIKDFHQKESELVSELHSKLQEKGFEVERQEKHPPQIT